LDIGGIIREINNLVEEYQMILDNKDTSSEDLNEARAILYFIGYLYPEKIALESLEKRIKNIIPTISLDEFLLAIDRKDKKVLSKYENNEKLNRLKEFYLIIKDIKNRVRNNTYLDEERFNQLYFRLKPEDYF
jgi:hypothetical protein